MTNTDSPHRTADDASNRAGDRPQGRNILVTYDFADAAVGYRWTDEEPRRRGWYDFGVFATFGEAKAAALTELRNERDRWTEAIRQHRTARVSSVQ